MDKTQSEQQCPRCSHSSLAVYYSENTDMKLGAACSVCGFKGYYADGKLVALVNV